MSLRRRFRPGNPAADFGRDGLTASQGGFDYEHDGDGAVEVRGTVASVHGTASPKHQLTRISRSYFAAGDTDPSTGGAFLTLGIPENLSAADPSRYFRRMWFRHGAERSDSGRIVAEFGIRVPAITAPLATLSGGNQQKTMLARWLRRTPRVLLLDEPTQGVDVGARADIYKQVRAAVLDGAAAIVVSSDFDELLLLADRILVLCAGRMVATAASASIDLNWLAERVYAIPEERTV